VTGNFPTPYDGEDEDDVGRDLPPVSERSRSVALILGLLGGVFGLHRYYAGRTESGVWMLLTLGGMGMWWLYDMVMVVAGEFRDREGLPLRNWGIAEGVAGSGVDARQVGLLTRQVEQLQQQVGELAERVDFAERLLAQQRERERLSRGS
jgi:TM2 domain-containing membrane protein YozV